MFSTYYAIVLYNIDLDVTLMSYSKVHLFIARVHLSSSVSF